jgi:hypothetical protein
MPLRYGTPFRKAFSDPEIFSAFVRDVTGVEFEFTRIEQEKGFPPPVGRIDIRFDLYGEDIKRRAIVELHHAREAEAFSRIHDRNLVAQIEQITSHKDYIAERTVYTIVVLTRLPEDEELRFKPGSESKDIVTHDGRPLGLFNHRIIIVNPHAVTSTTPPALRKWLELLLDSQDHCIDESTYPDPLFRRVIDAIQERLLSGKERYWYREEAIWEETKTTDRKEGRDEGLKEAREELFKDGLKEGLRKRVVDICDILGITLDDFNKAQLESLDVEALEALRERIKKEKRWPTDS